MTSDPIAQIASKFRKLLPATKDGFLSADAILNAGINFDASKIPAFVAEDWSKYDLNIIKQCQQQLKDIPRHKVLARLVEEITNNSKGELDALKKMIFFCQAVSKNFQARQPVHDKEGNTIVSDPLILLSLNEMRCGHVARLAVDLCRAYGWESRLVQLGGHVIAEAKVEGQWRIFDADLFGGGEIPLLENGHHPSFVELSTEPSALDRLFFNGEHTVYNTKDTSLYSAVYPSYFYYSVFAYGNTQPVYYNKTATTTDEKGDPLFGWEHYSISPVEHHEQTANTMLYTPGIASFTNVTNRSGSYYVEWLSVSDRSNMLDDTRVGLAPNSRGYNPCCFFGIPEIEPLFSPKHTITAETYKSIFQSPKFAYEVGVKSENSVMLERELVEANPYLNISMTDSYGRSIGKKVWPTSYELKLPPLEDLPVWTPTS